MPAVKVAADSLRPPHPGSLSRTRLGGLVAAQRPQMVAVSAPVGYGKSSLMAEWARRDPRPTAWIDLGRAGDDATALVRLIAVALDTICPVDPTIFGDLAFLTSASVLDWVVPRLISAVSTADPVLLLLDGVDQVGDQACRKALTGLVDHLPQGSTVAAAGRSEVWLDLARRRAMGELLEVGPRELAFGVDEAAQLLALAGVHISAEALEALHSRTEGWPTGLYLAALALRDGSSGLAGRFTPRTSQKQPREVRLRAPRLMVPPRSNRPGPGCGR